MFTPLPRFTVALTFLIVAAGIPAFAVRSTSEAATFVWPAASLAPSAAPAPLTEATPRAVEGAENLLSGVSFDAADAVSCCGDTTVVPSRPNVAAGPDHLVVATVLDIEIFSTAGASLVGPLELETFFGSLGSNCQAAYFPDALYDESADRFVLVAVGGNSRSLCVAASQTPNPSGGWYLYQFTVGSEGDFLDSVQAGIGHEAIFATAWVFGDNAEAIALDKQAVLAGTVATFVTKDLGFAGYAHPVHLHGWRTGTWPASDIHYIVGIPDVGQPGDMQLFAWDDPFGTNSLGAPQGLDLDALHGVTLAAPVANPQSGSAATISGNDARVRDFEYRSGHGWVTNHASCNPGGGAVNCLQWAKIDLGSATVVEAGVFGSTGVYRAYGDLAVDRCDNLALGYSRFSAAIFPSSYVAGALSNDPAGSLRPELVAKAGTVAYASFSDRWGEFTGMTIDPAGTRFWYAGVYSKLLITSTNWATHVGSFSFPSCEQIFSDGFESGNTTAWSLTNP